MSVALQQKKWMDADIFMAIKCSSILQILVTLLLLGDTSSVQSLNCLPTEENPTCAWLVHWWHFFLGRGGWPWSFWNTTVLSVYRLQVAGSLLHHKAFHMLQLQTVTSGAAIQHWQGVCIVFVCVCVCNCSLGQPYPPAKKKKQSMY